MEKTRQKGLKVVFLGAYFRCGLKALFYKGLSEVLAEEEIWDYKKEGF